MVTVTAPGARELPDSAAIELWNRSAPSRWSKLHRAASAAARRTGGAPRVLGMVWQMQRRGALHVHVVLGYGTAADASSAWNYRCELQRLSSSYGFGYVDGRNRGDGSTVMEGGKAARYLSKYLTESSQLARALGWVSRPVYVARSLTMLTGCTMRRLRRVRFLWWIRRGASTAVQRAGTLPRWMLDSREHALVSALALAAP